MAGGTDAWRLHGLRGERSNEPRRSAGLYGAEGSKKRLKFAKECNKSDGESLILQKTYSTMI